MSAYTTKYRLTKPTVGGDADAWGGLLNTDMDSLDTLLGVIATGGSANAYTLTTGQSLTAYADGQTFNIRASFTNSGAATMNIDGLGAKNLRKVVSGTLTALASGDIASGDYLRVSYYLASDVLVVHGGSSTLDATLVAMAAGTTGADVLWYWSGTDTLSTTTLTTAGRALLDDAAASNQRTTLGLVIGTDVQAYDAELAALAGLTSAADQLPYFTGSGTASLATFTAAGRALVDDADASAQRTTLGLGTAATQNIGTSGATVPLLNGVNTWGANQTIQATSQQGFTVHRATNTASTFCGVYFSLLDSASNTTSYVNMLGGIADNTDTSEDGRWVLQMLKAGSQVSVLDINAATDTLAITNIGAVTCAGVVLVPAGSASAPSLSFSADTNTGWFNSSADVMRATLGGTGRWDFTTAGLVALSNYVLQAGDGSASTPGLGFAQDTNSGWYRIGADNIGLSLAGALAVDYSTSRIAITSTIDLQRGASPSALTTESVGYMGLGAPQVKTAAYTLVLTDAAKVIRHNSASSHAITIPTFASVAYPNGTAIPVENMGAGTMVLTPDTGVTLLNDAGTSGSITLNNHQGGVLIRDADTGTNTWRYRGSHA